MNFKTEDTRSLAVIAASAFAGLAVVAAVSLVQLARSSVDFGGSEPSGGGVSEREFGIGLVRVDGSLRVAEPRGGDALPMDPSLSMVNTVEFRERLAAAYPALLRDAGIGGTVLVALEIDREGRVGHAEVAESSGHRALDEAAIGAAWHMRFHASASDALRRAEIPLTFALRGDEPRTRITRIRVSGGSSGDPVVYVDGIRWDGALAEIKPADIEKIDVIKGDAARIEYGSEATYGVVRITTKGGASR